MKSKSQVKNKGEELKVERPNYLIPPYRKTTPQEQKQYEQSKQLTILPILQPTPHQLIQHQQVQKPKQVRTKPTTKPTPTPKKDLKKQKEEMLDWLNNIKIQ